MPFSRRDLLEWSSLAGLMSIFGGPNRALGQQASKRAPKTPSSPKVSEAKAKGLTRYVCEFVLNTQYRDIPENVIELGKKSILDGVGLALAGSVAKTGELTRKYLLQLGCGSGSSTLVGSSQKAVTRFAAFSNGVGIHADDYDDTQLSSAPDRQYGLLTHPTAPVLPVVLALGELKGISGRDAMLAYHLGVEVECKISESMNPRHYEDGFHSTGTCGAFGAVTAASKLEGLDLRTMANAFGLAGSQASGLRENFGTMTKPFHAGHAAEAGVVSAELAALGWTASDTILEAPRGFFKAEGGGFDPEAIVGKLGNPWTFANPGISIKPHPCGSLTHPGMGEMLRLIRANDIRPDQVERVDVGTNHNTPNALIHHQPKNALQAKFSMEFCMAALLLYRKAGLMEFTDEVVNRPEVQAMIRRVHFGVNPEAERAGFNKMTTIIDIHLKNGKTISGRADFGKGSPANPMSFDEVSDKFMDCAMYAKWPADKAKAIVETVRKMETLKDMRELTRLCSA